MLEWAKSGRYVKAIKNVCNDRGTVGVFLLLFFKGSCYFAFFHSKPNVRNSCTDGQFWSIFSVLEMGFVHQILICSPSFCDFCLCSLHFPSSTGIQVPLQDIFPYVSFFRRERDVIVLPVSMFPNNTVLDDPKKQTTGNSGFYKSCDPRAEDRSHVPTTSMAQGLESNSHYRENWSDLLCCHWHPPVMLQDILTLGRRNSSSWTCSPFLCTFMLFIPLCCSTCLFPLLSDALQWPIPAAELAGSVLSVEQTCPLTMEGKGRLPCNHNYSAAPALPTTARVLQSLLAHWGLQCSLRC